MSEVEMAIRSFCSSLCALLVLAFGFLATEGLAYDSWDNQSSAVDYAPSGVGSDSASLRIKSDDQDEPNATVGLSGSGQTAAGDPDIDVSPLSLDFGAVTVGNTVTLTTTIRNLGGADLTVDRLSMRGSRDFELDASAPSVPFVVASGASVDLSIHFTPSRARARDGRLLIDSDDPDEDPVEVTLSGVGQ
jgi:hypothetical protein